MLLEMWNPEGIGNLESSDQCPANLQDQIVLLLMDSSVRNQTDAEVQKGMS